jgi:hypothetical protein
MAGLKRWCDEFAVFAVNIALADEQAIAEDGAKGSMDENPFIEIVGMLNKNGMHVIGGVENEQRKGAEVHAANVAALLCDAQEQIETLAVVGGQVSKQRGAFHEWDGFECL